MLIIIPNAYHIIANKREFPYLQKSEGKDKMANRIINQCRVDDHSLKEELRNYTDKVHKEKKF